MAVWVREEKKAPENRQRKREAEEADKVEVAPGVTVVSLRRFRAVLIGPTQGQAASAVPIEKPANLRIRCLKKNQCCYRCSAFEYKCEILVVAIRGVSDGYFNGWRYTKLSLI